VPNTATVTDWLTTYSLQLDGEIGHVVSVPVSEADSPNLHTVCTRIVLLRTQADVYDQVYAAGAGEAVTSRRSNVMRGQASDLVKAIQRGATGDGTSLSDRPENPGAPEGYFGDDTTPHTQMGGKV